MCSKLFRINCAFEKRKRFFPLQDSWFSRIFDYELVVCVLAISFRYVLLSRRVRAYTMPVRESDICSVLLVSTTVLHRVTRNSCRYPHKNSLGMLEGILPELVGRTSLIPPVISSVIVLKTLHGFPPSIFWEFFWVISPVVTQWKIPKQISSGEPTKFYYRVFGYMCSGIFLKILQKMLQELQRWYFHHFSQLFSHELLQCFHRESSKELFE